MESNAMISRKWLPCCLAVAIVLLAVPLHSQADLLTLIRKKTVPSAQQPPTMNGLARLVTHLEDDLRKYGSITVKAPDVWGESTLMSMVQEYERFMREDAIDFKENMQGYVARADQASLQAEFALGLAASNATEANNSAAVEAPGPATTTTTFAEAPGKPFEFLDKDVGKFALSLEPTEHTREHSVFLKVNQSLRRTNLGDDNSRQPGYTSYVLRFPVSVIPGRNTYQGCAAVVNLRARIVLGESHLHDTFPRLVASEAADKIAGWLLVNWDSKKLQTPSSQASTPSRTPKDPDGAGKKDDRRIEPIQAVTDQALLALYGEENLKTIRGVVHCHFHDYPKEDELEAFLFSYLMQAHLAMERRSLYSLFAPQILETGLSFSQGCLNQVENLRCSVQNTMKPLNTEPNETCPAANCMSECQSNEAAAAGWVLFAQSAVLDQNIKRLLRAQGGDCGVPAEMTLGELRFFEPFGEPYLEASAVWNQFIEQEFPVHLFTLDPIVEQQNYYDAFSRRRELQLSMAMAVAKGEMRARQAVRFTRQLSLDMLTIGLNRTAVAYAADNDTFGWYFYPRLQSPPEESSNIVAFARLLWSTGPTRRYDLRHRQLEPGIRECEAVIVMPAFVPRLKIDITTNWERLVKPGSIKVDYVKMIDEAAMIQQAVGYSSGVSDQECYRPEDYDILCSRIDQLEKMLPMQQQLVRLPFPYVLSGTELFDDGNRHLPPVLNDYYGLELLPSAKPSTGGNGESPEPNPSGGAGGSGGFHGGGGGGGGASVVNITNTLAAEKEAQASGGKASPGVYFFLTGRHFHPTQTHVIVGGVKSDSVDATPATSAAPVSADVIVMSRELLRVKLSPIDKDLNDKCVAVYVATPAGVSNRLLIPLLGGENKVANCRPTPQPACITCEPLPCPEVPGAPEEVPPAPQINGPAGTDAELDSNKGTDDPFKDATQRPPDRFVPTDQAKAPANPGAHRPAKTPRVGRRPSPQPDVTNPLRLEQAAQLRPVRLPPVEDRAVRQAAAWER
jgi:uncharacterized membrane protein YgcG